MSDSAKPRTTVQRSYGRGFHDGLEKAKEEMNLAKYDRAISGLTSVARKVLECVPNQQMWTVHKIGCEVVRKGMNYDKSTIVGVLNSLKGDGLIVEPERGSFMKAAMNAGFDELDGIPSPDKPPLRIVVAAPNANQEPPSKPKDTLQTLADLSATLRAKAQELESLAKSIDDAALDVEGRIAQASAGNEKLLQLQALLRSIGGP